MPKSTAGRALDALSAALLAVADLATEKGWEGAEIDDLEAICGDLRDIGDELKDVLLDRKERWRLKKELQAGMAAKSAKVADLGHGEGFNPPKIKV